MTNPGSEIWENIVVLDDDPTYREYISALISQRKGFNACVATGYHELEQFLRAGYVDCILLDYDLGDESGLLVWKRLAEQFECLPPVILLTGDERQGTVIKALRAGVSDFLPKRNLTPLSLFASINKAVEAHRADRRIRMELKRLSEAAVRDPLTGLASKGALEARLGHFAKSDASFYNGVIIGITIDSFASIDTLGRATSDRVVQVFAKKLQAALKPSEICGRYCEDTFLIIDQEDTAVAGLDARCADLERAVCFRADLASVSLNLSGSVRGLTKEEAQELQPFAKRASFCDPTGSRPRSAPQRTTESGSPLRTENRRREPRTRVFKRGQVVIAGLATIDCTVRNISQHGAGLRFDSPFVAPTHFALSIVGAERSQAVEVRWQNGCDLGVAFLD